MKNLLQYIGLRHLRMKPARTILTTLGVAFGIALYVAIAIINHSTRDSFRENIEAVSGKAQLTVSAGDVGFPEEKIEIVKEVPGVKAAVPMVESRAYFGGKENGDQGLYVLGVDLLQEQSVRSYKATNEEIIEDPLLFLNQPDSIVVTKTFAQSKGIGIDSKLQLVTTAGVKQFTVRGLLEPEGPAKAYGGSLAIMDIDGARYSFGKDGRTDRIDIIPVEGVDVDQLAKAIHEKLGPEYTVERPSAQAESTENMIASYQMMLTFFSSLALLVGLFLVLNSVSISVAERRKEIGILRALGATRAAIITIFVGESAVMGLVGSLLGCALGRVLSDLMVSQVVYSVAAQYHTRIEVTNLVLTTQEATTTTLLGVITASLSALWPAYRASRVHPLEAMKSHGVEAYASEKNRGFMVGFGGALLIFVYLSMHFQLNRHWSGFEQLTQGASVLGSALFGPYLVFHLIRGLKRAFSGMQRPILRLAQDNLLRSRKRTSSNIMALMVGLFLVMLIATVRASFHDTLVAWMNNVLTADVIVTGSGSLTQADTQPMDEKIQSMIAKTPGLRPVEEGRGASTRIVVTRSKGVRYAVKAIDRASSYAEYRGIPVVGGDRVELAEKMFTSAEPSIMASENFFIKNPQLQVGSLFELDTPMGRTNFRIVAKVIDYASSEGTLYMPRETYKRLWRDSFVTSFAFYLEPGAKLEEVRSAIDRELGAKYGLTVVSNRELRDELIASVDKSFAYTRAVEFAALLVALLGLLNTLLISVMERTREIGMLRAIGTSRRQISNMILGESVIQGGFGAIIAVLIGGWVGKLWIENSLAHALGWIIDFSFPLHSVLITIGVGIFVAWLAGLYPSKRAADLPITEALDYE